MKSFWASILICGILILLIIWNSLYIHRVCGELTEAAIALPACPEGETALGSLIERWGQEHVYIDLTVSRHQIDKINDCLYEWQSAAKTGDEAEYERCRYLFLSLVNQILRTESVTVGNWI